MFPLKSAIMDFEVHCEKYAPLKSLLYYIIITCKKFSFALFLNLRYFGRREDIFCPFSGILIGYYGNGVPFWFFFDIFKTINMYTPYLGTGHWLENPFKIMGIKPLKQILNYHALLQQKYVTVNQGDFMNEKPFFEK